MNALYNRALTVSLVSGADYTGYTGATEGQNRFAVINPNPIAAGSYTPPDNPGRFYGSSAGAPAIDAGNVLVNTVAGGDCPVIIVGKALPGQPIECQFGGGSVVVVGVGGVTVGSPIMSDDTGAAVNWSAGNHILGYALATGAAGDQVAILFHPRGEA